MAVTVTHSKTLVSPDSGVADKIYGADYVAANSHSVAGLGALAELNAVTEATITLADNVTNDVSATRHGFAPKLPNNTTTFLRGDGTYATPSGGAALSGITAATAANTLANGANVDQIWNWSATVNSKDAFKLGETVAATGGTSTLGVPNQVLLRLSTLAASTMSALRVDVRAAFLMAASPSTTQMLFAAGTGTAPTICPASSLSSGISFPDDRVRLSAGGVSYLALNPGGSGSLGIVAGSTGVPGLTDLTSSNFGLYWPSSGAMSITGNINGTDYVKFATTSTIFLPSGTETLRLTAGVSQLSLAGAVTTGYAINARKARGTVASPTAITTGDDVLTISGFPYVGATGGYVEAGRLTLDSVGTIADTTSGVGGIARMSLAAVGAVGVSEVMRWQRATTTGGGWASMDEADANPAVGDLVAAEEFAMYRKADKFVIAHNIAGVMNYLTIPLDGSSTAWTQGTVAP